MLLAILYFIFCIYTIWAIKGVIYQIREAKKGFNKKGPDTEINPYMTLVTMISDARQEKNISQAELAVIVNVPVSVIRMLEKEGRFTTALTLRRITDALGKDVQIKLVDKQPPNT